MLKCKKILNDDLFYKESSWNGWTVISFLKNTILKPYKQCCMLFFFENYFLIEGGGITY